MHRQKNLSRCIPDGALIIPPDTLIMMNTLMIMVVDIDEIEVAENAEKGSLPKKKAEPKRTSLKKPVSRASQKGPKKKKTKIDAGKSANS